MSVDVHQPDDQLRQLRQSEEQLRLTFEIAPIGMAIVAVDGRFLRVNQALCTATGYAADELLRCTFADITYPDDLAEQQALDQQLLNGQMPFVQTERRYLGKDGRLIDALMHVALVRDAQGHPLSASITKNATLHQQLAPAGFIQKPFTFKALQAKVQRAVAAGSQP